MNLVPEPESKHGLGDFQFDYCVHAFITTFFISGGSRSRIAGAAEERSVYNSGVRYALCHV